MATDPKILNLEADARFATSTGRPVGQKLDPSNPADAALIPQWKDIAAQVKAEDDAGKLVLTYNHPAVAQPLADAHVADLAATMHRVHAAQAAAAADPATAQQHQEAAAVADSVKDQKTQEAAVAQNAVANGAAPPEIEMPPMDMRHPAAQQDAHARPGPGGHHRSGHHTAKGILEKETDARFALQSGVTHKLDPSNPADAKLIPTWLDIYKKVKAEDRAGQLVITYNHPVVAQNLADAQVADTVAATSIDTAAATPDPAAQQAHIEQAAVATQVSTQKKREAAQLQPPTISPQIAQEASRKTHAERAAREGHRQHGDAKRIDATYRRFWETTHYRPGQPLDPRDPQYARMLQIWMSIYTQTQGGHHGHGPRTGREHIAEQQASAAGHRAAETHHRHKHRGGRQPRSTMGHGSVQNYRSHAAQLAHSTGSPYALVVQHPDGQTEQHGYGSRPEVEAAYAGIADQHDQYKYVGAFDNANPSAPIVDSVGTHAAENVDQPASDEAGTPPSDQTEAAPEEKKSSIGKIVAIVAAVAAAGGITYMVTRKPARKGGASSTTTRVAKLPFPGTVSARP